MLSKPPIGIVCDEQHLLTLAIIAKNYLFAVAGVSPIQAFFGKQPSILPDIDTILAQLDNTNGTPHGYIRGRHRLRELAAQTMIEQTARTRIALALRSKTRPSVQQYAYKKDEKVEFYRSPANKDMQGWRGPATIVNVKDDGMIFI